MTSYNIYLKPTNKCQLKCRHCYTGDVVTGEMDSETLQNSISWINAFVYSHPSDVVSVILHGGESTRYDIDSLIGVVQQIKQVKWGITTNLVYKLQDNHTKLFKLMMERDDQFIIQTSWDHHIRFDNKEQLALW